MKILMTAAALAAVLVSAGTAMAAPVPGAAATMVPAPSGHRGQYASNQNLKTARRHVERAIDKLQHDTEDYGGHREKAIDDLGLARQYLEQALQFQNSHGRVSGTPVPNVLPIGNPIGRPVGNPVTTPVDQPDSGNGNGNGNENGNNNGGQNGNQFERGQAASNQNIQQVRRHVEAAIDALNRDASDYGGNKERAIDRLQAARGELEAALDFVHRRGVQNGGSGQRVSDANLQYVSEHVQTAIARLGQDRKDYGGHRVAAINNLQNALGFINSALAYDKSHGDKSNPVPNVLPGTTNALPNGLPTMIPARQGSSQGSSNASLVDARRHIETAIDALNRDAHDYGGFRVKALVALQAARSELLQALNFRRGN